MWAPFGHHFTENNAFHQGMEKAAKPSNHVALRLFSVHIKHVENDTKIYYFLYPTGWQSMGVWGEASFRAFARASLFMLARG